MKANESLIHLAKATLRQNDQGGYTVPTHGLYPFQWNWDSAVVALGWLTFDEARAWEEVQWLLKGQWANGMVPHIVFHENADSYFPGPDVWGVTPEATGNPVIGTSISQPPVLATVVRQLYEKAENKPQAEQKVREILPQLLRYHLWWYQQRDPENTGLVVSYHPWESGMDNSPAWDKALAAVPPVEWEYERRDTGYINANERPHKAEYDRFLYLVDLFKRLNFDESKIYQQSPYQIYDIGIIGILHRATRDLLHVCNALGESNDQTQFLASRLPLTEHAVNKLWNPETATFHSWNKLTDEMCDYRTTGGLMALFGGLATQEQSEQMQTLVTQWCKLNPFAVSSTHPQEPIYEPQRYWRGPIWLHINWMIAEGLKDYGFNALSEKIRQSSQDLIIKSGYNESYHAEQGICSGGGEFSWTAAIALYWLL